MGVAEVLAHDTVTRASSSDGLHGAVRALHAAGHGLRNSAAEVAETELAGAHADD